ncbi:MAG: extracellular solute-binding protein [Actinomycetes bacterium]
MTRRSWTTATAVGIAMMLAAVSTSCASNSSSDVQPTESNTVESVPLPIDSKCPEHVLDDLATPVAITAWAALAGDARSALDLVVARYNASQTKVRVTITSAPVDPPTQRAIYAVAAESGQLPALIAVDTSLSQFLIGTSTVAAASDCHRSDGLAVVSLPVVRNATTVGDTHWAGSANPETDVLFYRRDAFSAAGLDPDSPPRTLAELQQAAEKLKAAGATTAPIVLAGTASLIENWLTGAGAQIVDQSNGHLKQATRSTFDNPQTLELYQWISHMVEAGLLAIEPTSTGDQPASSPETRLQSASMTVAPSTLIGPLSSSTTSAMADLDVSPFPGMQAAGKGAVGGLAWFPTTTGLAAVQAASWDFLNYLNLPESQVTINIISSYLPNNIRATDDRVLEAMWADTRRGRWLDTAYTQLTNLDPAIPGPMIGPDDQVRAAIRTSLQALIAGTAATDVIAAANLAIDQAVKAAPVAKN